MKIVKALRYLEKKDLNYGRSGNISVRVGVDKVLITLSGLCGS